MSIVDEPADLQYPDQPQPQAPAPIQPHPSLSYCRPDEIRAALAWLEAHNALKGA